MINRLIKLISAAIVFTFLCYEFHKPADCMLHLRILCVDFSTIILFWVTFYNDSDNKSFYSLAYTARQCQQMN